MILYAACWIRRPREFGVVRLAQAAAAVLAAVTVFVLAIYWPETVRALRGELPRMADLATRNNPIGEATVPGRPALWATGARHVCWVSITWPTTMRAAMTATCWGCAPSPAGGITFRWSSR